MSIGFQAHQKLTKLERLNCCPIFGASENHTDLFHGRMANQRRHVANLWRCGLGTASTRRVLAVRGLAKCIECIECHETFVFLNRDAVSTGFQCVSVCCKEIRNLPWYGASIPTPMRQAAFAKLFLGDSWCVVFWSFLICISLRWGHPKISTPVGSREGWKIAICSGP